MKSKKLVVALLTVAIASTTALVGCGNAGSSSGAKLDKEQFLNVGIGFEPQGLDPSRATDVYSTYILTESQEALTRCEQDKDGKDVIKPAGAESWKVSDDGLVWTFKLRDNKWQDGQVVKASDYEYSLKRTLDPKSASENAYLLDPIKGANAYNSTKGKVEDVAIKAIDDKTLEIKLTAPCAYFVNLTYFKLFTPQRKDIVDKSGEKFGTEAETMISSGSFVIKSWVHKNKIELEKNPNYWDKDNVKLNKLTFKIIEDEQARMNEVLNGSVDTSLAEKKEWKDKFDQTGKFDVVAGYEPTTDYVSFNQKDKLFSNVKVRKAFSLALNREDYCKTLYPGARVPAYAWSPPSLQIGTEDFRKKVGSDPAKKLQEENKDVKALFIQGLKELGLGEDPSKITVTITSGSTTARAKQMEEYRQQEYQKALGCVIKIDYMDWGIFQDKMKKRQYQIAGQAWTGDYNDPMTEFDMWTSTSGMNRTGWSSKEYDDIIAKAGSTMDQTVRFNLFKQAEEILISRDAVFSPIDYRQRTQYKRKYVKNFMGTLFGSTMEYKYVYTEGRESK